MKPNVMPTRLDDPTLAWVKACAERDNITIAEVLRRIVQAERRRRGLGA